MSYILEALKKSDQERRQGHVPDLQTVHLSTPEQASRPLWWPVLWSLVLVGAAFVLGWMRPWDLADNHRENSQPGLASQSTSQPAGRSASESSAKPLESAVPLVTTPSRSASQASVRQPQLEEVMQSASQRIIDDRQGLVEPSLAMDSLPYLNELPSLIQQAVPQMEFAGHVYSSTPSQRSVIINGASMSEGEQLITGLSVEQITSKGVVFDYQGTLFRLDVLQDWSF